MKAFLFSISMVIFIFSISCKQKDEVKSEDSNPIVSTIKAEVNEPSPYYGWFKDKNEFSFTSVSITTGESHGMKMENTVTSYYYVKNGKEAVKETTLTTVNGTLQPEQQKIYITSKEGNFVVNPLTKTYYKEAGDYNATMFSKVWVWTRKRSDSYDALSNNSSVVRSTETIDEGNVECFMISGVKFYFDNNKKLLKYMGSAAGMNTIITLQDYKTENVPDFIEECISSIEKDAYVLVDSQFNL